MLWVSGHLGSVFSFVFIFSSFFLLFVRYFFCIFHFFPFFLLFLAAFSLGALGALGALGVRACMAPRAATALDGRWLHFWYTTPMAEGAGCASGTSYGGGGAGGGGLMASCGGVWRWRSLAS